MSTTPAIHKITPENPPQFRDGIKTWVFNPAAGPWKSVNVWLEVTGPQGVRHTDTHWCHSPTRPTADPSPPAAKTERDTETDLGKHTTGTEPAPSSKPKPSFVLIEHGDGGPHVIRPFATEKEREDATACAIFGSLDNVEAEPLASCLATLRQDGSLTFEGDPSLEWMTAFVEPTAAALNADKGRDPSASGHSPLPWEYQENSDAYTHIIRGPGGKYIVGFSQDASGSAEADARFVVEACNNYEALRELKRDMQGTEAIWDAVQELSPWHESNDMDWVDEILCGLQGVKAKLAAVNAETELSELPEPSAEKSAHCFWPTGCSDRKRCGAFGDCVAKAQNLAVRLGREDRPMDAASAAAKLSGDPQAEIDVLRLIKTDLETELTALRDQLAATKLQLKGAHDLMRSALDAELELRAQLATVQRERDEAKQALAKAEEDELNAIDERDHLESVINDLCTAAGHKFCFDFEWTCQYGFADAIRDVEDKHDLLESRLAASERIRGELAEALECMMVGACAVAVPNIHEREVLFDAAKIGRKALAAHQSAVAAQPPGVGE